MFRARGIASYCGVVITGSKSGESCGDDNSGGGSSGGGKTDDSGSGNGESGSGNGAEKGAPL